MTVRIQGRQRIGSVDADVAVVLLHGYLCVSERAYWHSALRSIAPPGQGRNPVVLGRVPRTARVVTRASHLARFLGRLPHRRVVLVGHSMGGLDARFATGLGGSIG